MNRAKESPWAEAVAHLRSDARLAAVIDEVGEHPPPPGRGRDLFGSLMRSIVYQQLHGRAAASIYSRVAALLPDPDHPTPEAVGGVSDEAFRAAGLSRAKLAAIRDLADHVARGALPKPDELERCSDEALIERITVVKGIGPWTVQMWMMFDLGRPDVWPVTDYGLRTAVARLWRRRALPDAELMNRAARKWRPWRTVASWYLWRWVDQAEA